MFIEVNLSEAVLVCILFSVDLWVWRVLLSGESSGCCGNCVCRILSSHLVSKCWACRAAASCGLSARLWLQPSQIGNTKAHCWVPMAGHRLIHSPSLVAVGLSVGYEIWPLIGCYHTFVIGWYKYRLGLLKSQSIVGSHDQWELPPFLRGHWQYSLNSRQMLCKETVKESRLATRFSWSPLLSSHVPLKKNSLKKKLYSCITDPFCNGVNQETHDLNWMMFRIFLLEFRCITRKWSVPFKNILNKIWGCENFYFCVAQHWIFMAEPSTDHTVPGLVILI